MDSVALENDMNAAIVRAGTFAALFLCVALTTSCGEAAVGPCNALWWSANDIEGVKLSTSDPNARLRVAQVTLHQKPPFYVGDMPFTYEANIFDVVPLGMAMGHGGIVIQTKAGGVQNLFVYPSSIPEKLSGVPIGAVTFVGDRLVAEAKLLSRNRDSLQIKEVQYDPKRCQVFSATSVFDSGLGFKKEELESAGKKRAEYYFLWPTRGQ
jgi:hypothetical protein